MKGCGSWNAFLIKFSAGFLPCSIMTSIRWVASGLPYGNEKDPVVTKISVVPEHRILTRNNHQQFAVYAHYSDGTTEDISRLPLQFVTWFADSPFVALPDPRNRAWRKKQLEKIVRRIRDTSVGREGYSGIDFTEDVKCACAREGVAFDHDLFNELVG